MSKILPLRFVLIFVCLVGLFSAPVPAVQEDLKHEELRVLTFNIHAGKGLGGKIDLQQIANVIRDAKPDLVALQEVDFKTKRSGYVDQAKTLAELCDMKSVFGKAMNYQGGQYGNALLTSREIIASNVVQVSSVGAEPRSAVGIAVRLKDKQIVTLISTH